MKKSRKVIVALLLLTALFCAGAILGSLVPKVVIYTTVGSIAVAITIIGLWFYNGNEQKEEDENP